MTEQSRQQAGGRAPAAGGKAYLGSFTSDGGRGITTATVDADTGALRAVHHTGDGVPDPSYLVLGGGLLHSVCERDDGAAAALSLADPARPGLLGEPVTVHGAAPTHLARTNGLLCTANYGSGSVSVLRLRADGAPAGPPRVHRHTGGGPVSGRQDEPHAHAVVVDPSGRWLLSVDLGTDSVWVSAIEAGGLRPHREFPVRPGSGPRHLTFRPDGSRAYLVNELEPTLTVCRWDADAGELAPLGETALVAPGTTGEAFPSEMVFSADGRTAWAAVRGADSIAVLALDPPGDTAQYVTSVPCGGHWPRDLALHPSGRWLYAANERSGDVTWFELGPETRVPRRSGALQAPAVSCVVFGP